MGGISCGRGDGQSAEEVARSAKMPKVFLDGLTNRLRMNHCYDAEDFDPELTAPDAK
jgi:hypothetical protein